MKKLTTPLLAPFFKRCVAASNAIRSNAAKRIVSVVILLLAGVSTTALAQTQIGQRSGRLEWGGWTLDYKTFTKNDGLTLHDVQFNGKKILARASFPVMSVYYDDNRCGPYADRLNGPQQPVPWAANARLVAREFTQNGKRWFEIGIREFIGAYDIYQTWYFSADGELDGHTFARGLQCRVNHEHYPMWRLDFDIDGASNDRILRQTATNTFTTMTREFESGATSAYQHGWYVEDSVTGSRIKLNFDNGAWNVSGTVIPETAYAQNRVGGVRHRSSEEAWPGRPSKSFPNVNGENIADTDIALWYRGFLPHLSSEGSALWHSTGFRITVESRGVDTDGDGIPDATDPDDDNDGVLDQDDAFPLDRNESLDTDGDGIGNNADTDDDGDGVADNQDAFPLDRNESVDTDGDGIGNNADTDDDGDGVLDDQDVFPLDRDESVDTDGDGIGNNADTDDDGDGVLDGQDAFPLDRDESVDTDGDGIGNNADTDDDNDGTPDHLDPAPLDPNIGGTQCNRIGNAQFETDVAGWQSNVTPTQVNDSHGGNKAMNFAGGWVSSVIPVTASAAHTVTGFYKSTGSTGWIGLGMDFVNDDGQEIGEAILSLTYSATYTAFSLDGQVPSGTTRIRLWFYSGGTTSLTLDDLDLRKSGCTSVGGQGNQPPSVSNPGTQTGDRAAATQLQIAASDAENDVLTYTASGLPSGLSIHPQTGLISGTPDTATTTQVTITVSDASHRSPIQFYWTINEPGTTSACNALDNPGFETGSNGWSTSASPILTSDAAQGNQALHFGAGWISATVAATANTEYTATGSFLANVGDGWTGFGMDFLDSAGAEIGEAVRTLDSSDIYSTFQLNGTTPANASQVRLWFYADADRTITVDALDLRKTSCR